MAPSPAGPRAIARLSVVIPAYNETLRIGRALERLSAAPASWRVSEVIVVDDGSTDGTADVVRAFHGSSGTPALRVETHAANRGKGAALRTGMAAATGDAVLFLDADLSVEPDAIDDALAAIEAGADVVAGTRRARGHVDGRVTQPRLRRLAGYGFWSLQRLLVGIRLQDTQCPFKLMTAAARDALADAHTVDGWAYDVELLVVAQQRGLSIRELPVRFEHVGGSTVRMTPGSIARITGDLLRIRRTHGTARHARAMRRDEAGAPRA